MPPVYYKTQIDEMIRLVNFMTYQGNYEDRSFILAHSSGDSSLRLGWVTTLGLWQEWQIMTACGGTNW
jgi:hypothetical protein